MTNDPSTDAATWAGFAGAIVRITLPRGLATLRPAEPGTVGAFPFAGDIHIITAHNPAGQLVDAGANEAAHRALTAALAGRPTAPTVGSAEDGSMAEPGFALLDSDEAEALRLGARFGQAAIYRWTAEALQIIDTDGRVRNHAGWTLVADL